MGYEDMADTHESFGDGLIAVTGATGFIGRRLCARLRELGSAVRALTRREDAGLYGLGVDTRVVDLLNPADLSTALKDCRAIIHCAANPSFGNGPHYQRDNVDTTRTMLQAVRPDIDRFVLLSTIGAVDRAQADDCAEPLNEFSLPHPSSDYGRSKLQCEAMLKNSGLPFSIIRPAMVVGGDMRADSHFAVFARMALRRSPFARINWPGTMSVIHVDDLVEAIIHCATVPAARNRTFFCAGDPVGIGDYFRHVNPNCAAIPIRWALSPFRPLAARLPFQIKALLLPALTATDQALRETGWSPTRTGLAALREVVARERARCDPALDPGGLTLITGAASGLGQAFAQALAPVRNSLLLVDRDAEGLARMAAAHPKCRTVVVDLADRAELDRFLDSLAGEDVSELYACAGIGARGTVKELGLDVQQKVFEINLLTRLAMAHRLIGPMSARRLGRVVFVSSSSAFQPLPYMAAYAASNSALLSLGEAWGAELGRSGVHLLTVCPGGMKTNFQQSSGVKELEGEKLMPPEEVARQTLMALRSNRLSVAISLRSKAMSLAARVLPREVSARLWMRLMEKMR
jgi:short-subunit dehydrogenase